MTTLLALALVAAASLAGDANSTWKADDEKIAACFASMDRMPELQPINTKFARRDPTADQLADRSIATDAESSLLRLRVEKTRPCRELRLAAVRKSFPLLEPAYKTLYYQTDQVFEYLTNGWITFGEANRLSSKALAEFSARQKAFFDAKSEKRRQELSIDWDESLQRSHSNPPPARGTVNCLWVSTNLACAP
ncbi:MAG: hypothetical protein ABL996_10165 [Micropepsaceae bacterium]